MDPVLSSSHGQQIPFDGTTRGTATPLVSLVAARAGIKRGPVDADDQGEPEEKGDGAHRAKHAAVGAAIGAGVGLLVGVAIGLAEDRRSGDAIIPATPVVAAEGLGIGLVVGLVVGAFVR